MNLYTIIGPLLALLPLSEGFLTSSHTFKNTFLTKNQLTLNSKQLENYENYKNNMRLSSSIGIVDTVVDPEHESTRKKVFRSPYNPNSKTIGTPIVVDILGDGTQVNIGAMGALYKPEYTRFSRINAMISENMTVDWQDVQWYLKKKSNRKFLIAYSQYSHASHGTHVAGVSIKDNPKAKLLSIRFINEFGFSIGKEQKAAIDAADNKRLLASAIEASIAQGLNKMIVGLQQRYLSLASVANQFNIDVFNLSLGSPPGRVVIENILAINNLYLSEEKISALAQQYDHAIGDIVRICLAQSPNTVFVFAAGNEETNVDNVPYLYHVAKHPRGIVVGAVNDEHDFADFSNHGGIAVNIAAEGVNIPSSTPGNGLLYMSGTSMAAPAVTHAVALLIDAGLPAQFVKKVLMETATHYPQLKSHVESGVLDEEAALNKARKIVEENTQAGNI
ncbi:MAG: S8 family serine peptidase [Oligoflexales bacterium]